MMFPQNVSGNHTLCDALVLYLKLEFLPKFSQRSLIVGLLDRIYVFTTNYMFWCRSELGMRGSQNVY
jgi:hypothetical protein